MFVMASAIPVPTPARFIYCKSRPKHMGDPESRVASHGFEQFSNTCVSLTFAYFAIHAILKNLYSVLWVDRLFALLRSRGASPMGFPRTS
jgi:hypothetical protein